MVESQISTDVQFSGGDSAEIADEIKRLVEKAGALLPSQGPITAFVFLNTLQALENMPFDEGVQMGARLFGCQPYLTEDNYRDKMAYDRIRLDDVALALRRDLKGDADTIIANLVSRHQLQLAMMQFPIRTGPTEELQWFVAETDALTKFRSDAAPAVRDRFLIETKHWVMRDLRSNQAKKRRANGSTSAPYLPIDELIERFGKSSIERWTPSTWEVFSLQALWRICRSGIYGVAPSVDPTLLPNRHRDVLRMATEFDTDNLVHPVLIRFCAAFADQGFANWSLPRREEGIFKAFLSLYREANGTPEVWTQGLSKELERIEKANFSPVESVVESFELLGVPRQEWDEYITASLLALKGWAGLIWQLEVRPDRQALSANPGSLMELLAIRLILDRIALIHVCESVFPFKGPLKDFRSAVRAAIPRVTKYSVEQRAILIFQLAQVLGWSPPTLDRLTSDNWAELIFEIESFTSMERRRIFHQAYERYFRAQTLDALSVHCEETRTRPANPRFQSVYCIDTREESFRRHLEEVFPEAETFAAAGFFSVPMYYKGVADAHFSALCPIVIRPQHWVTEVVDPKLEAEHLRRAKTRRALGAATHRLHVRSRSIAGGALLTASLGMLASIPLVARVLFPRLTSQIRRRAGRFVQPPQITRLKLERTAANPSSSGDGIGFTVEEMANMGERLLRDIGLTSGFAPIVAFFGHGSYCLNNPHKSCYDCGACSGSAGAPNARALAAILNDPRVREIIRGRGLDIPDSVHFLGGLHNTCNDSITFFDADLLPATHKADFEIIRAKLDQTCERNAHERCRRFQSAPLDLSFAGALRHVQGRSEDLAQTRPEFGNASNAICVVGRRERTRGLYLDRRCFMQSYDPNNDDEDFTILGRILGAVVPVCSGISLQYFFSYIDSTGWGCGTKLPHNITSLMGVMDGAASDLRPGLPWQGVEIHEPVRLLMVIETTPEGIRKIMSRSEVVRNIIENGWVQLSLLDRDSNQILVYREGQFHVFDRSIEELPKVQSSLDWYRGWREHLEFAQIDPVEVDV